MLLPFNFQQDPYLIIDFSVNNPDLAPGHKPVLDLTNTPAFTEYVFGKLREAGALVGVGGYNEHRAIYHRSAHFGDAESSCDGPPCDGPPCDGPPCDGPPCDGPREIHLGIDFWAAAGTPVFAPLDGVVHSFQDNNRFGDYGPTIILQHERSAAGKPLACAPASFAESDLLTPRPAAFQPRYSLYGHLSRASLAGLYEGMPVRAGQQIAEIGPYPENGDWPPHLHFQLMTDMLGLRGDFPGVCSVADRARFLEICPDPNTLLRISGL